MDFSAVVQKAKRLLAGTDDGEEGHQGPDASSSCELVDHVYGRVCTTVEGREGPKKLSSDSERKSVFLFGPDAVKSVLLKQTAADILCSIGRDKDYLHYTMVDQKSTFWLILISSEQLSIAPATWDGVVEHTRVTFPDAFNDLMNNLEALKQRSFEEFEKEAGFRFLDAKKNRHGTGGTEAPPYFSYKYFCSLPKPRSAWQVRVFLFCELRLLKLFTGDGYTCNEGASGQRILEYLGPNVTLADLDPAKCAVLKMDVKYVDVLARCHR